MNEEHNKLVAYVLDEPDEAAFEIARLREEVEDLRNEARRDDRLIPWTVVSFLAGFVFALWVF